MRLNRLCFLLAALFCTAVPTRAAEHTLPAPNADGFVYFTADNATLEPNQRKVNLTGNVTLIQHTPEGRRRTITGENITFDETNTLVTSVGPVTLDDGNGNTLYGENVSANYTTQDFFAEKLSTQYPPLRVLNAERISSKNGTKILKKATITCCDNPTPHYTITVGKARVSPQQRVVLTNAVFRLDSFPIFYLPIFWRSLNSQKPWTTYVDFTQSDKVGVGILTSTIFRPVLGLRPTINLDYYTKSGIGMGGGLTAVESPTLRGSGEYYYINDHNADTLDLAGTKRWGLQGGYWWEMYDSSDHFNNTSGALYQFQTKFRKVSDPYFNDTFFRSNPFIFMPDQETNFSLARQTRKSTLRISYQEKDIFVWDKQTFMAEKRVLPEIKFMKLPFNDPLLKLSHRFEIDFNNTSSLLYKQNQPNEEGPYQKQAHAKWTTEKSFRLSRNLTFMPAVFYDQNITFEDKENNKKDTWIGRVGTEVNLQARSFLGTTNLGYQFTKRLSTGTLSSDTQAPDKGIEKNRLYISNYYRPTFQTHIRFESGFNLSDYTNDLTTGYGHELNWDHLKERIEPLLLEWGYTSSDGKINVFMQDQYDLIKKNMAFIAQTNFYFWNQHAGIGLNNFADHTDPGSLYTTNSDRYTVTTTWGWHSTDNKWLLDTGIDAVFFRGSTVGFNKMLRLAHSFHDARLELTVRHRNQNLSFAFRFNILCGAGAREKVQAPEDTYWYPWRQPGDLRD